MKLSIRLQNHGCKNHPLWWIVVAPNRKNIFGRFIEHVGYWSPRQGVYLQRQIILNMPRIKYWMSCGAVPTFKVQKFLSMWNVLPAPWYYKKSEEELAKQQPKEQQLNDKKKRKIEWKEKTKQRELIGPQNYFKEEARYKFMTGWKRKFQDLKHAQERQNEILRELLLHNEFSKIARINELSGKTTFSDTEQLEKLRESLAKARAELAFIKKNNPNGSIMQQAKTMKLVNDLCRQIRKTTSQNMMSIKKGMEALDSENLTEDMLKAKLEFELVTSKIQKNIDELQQFADLNKPVLLQEYADFLVGKKGLDPEQAYVQAQREFIQRGVSGNPVTKYQLMFWDDIQKQIASDDVDELHPELKDADAMTILKKAVQWGECFLPTRRSVHPVPDLESYNPDEYYEPIINHDFNIKVDDPLSPHQELQKYHQKKTKRSNVVV